MTIAGWGIYFSIVAALGILVGLAVYTAENKAVAIPFTIIVVLVSIGVLCGMLWYYSNTESGKRAMKTQESNLEGGIRRNIRVYDAIGNMLQEFEGTFDVDFNADDRRVLFDDENGKRHLIYFNSGTVIVEEK